MKTGTREGSPDNGPVVFRRFMVPSQALDKIILSISCKMCSSSPCNSVCVSCGNPGKSWISNLVKSRVGNPGKLAQCTNKIKFLSQVLANANATCFISYSGMHMYIQGDWIPLLMISYSMVVEMLSYKRIKKAKQFLDQLI